MSQFLYIILFFSLLNISHEVIPIWDISTSATNILPSTSNEHQYYVVDRELYGVKVKLRKVITRSATGIIHQNIFKNRGGERKFSRFRKYRKLL